MNQQQLRVAYYTIVRREIHRFARLWVQTIVPPAITICLYFIIFGNLIGARIGTMGGYSYMQFVVPGLIMMAVITNAYANVVSSFFGARFQNFVHEMLVSPMPNWVILLGYTTGGMARGLAVGLLVSLLSMFFADLPIHNIMVMAAMVLMTSILFSLLGFINAVYAETFDDISVIPTFVLTPLIYLGGVFYSIDLLSEFWQTVSRFNPILYMVNGFRYGILGVSDINIGFAFVMSAVFIVAAWCYCLYLLNVGKKLRL